MMTPGRRNGGALVATDGTTSDAVIPSRGFTKTSSGYQGTSDGWTDLATDHQMDWTYTAPQPGNVVQIGQTSLSGLTGRQHLTLAIGFADDNLRGGVDGARIAGIRDSPPSCRHMQPGGINISRRSNRSRDRRRSPRPSTTFRRWSSPPARTRPIAADSWPLRAAPGHGRMCCSRWPSTTRSGHGTSTRSPRP